MNLINSLSIYFKIFLCTIYFNYIFFSSNSSHICCTPYPTNTFTHSKHKNKDQNKQPIRLKQNKQKHGVHFVLTNYSWAWGDISHVTLHGESPEGKYFLVTIGTLCPFPLLNAGILSCLNLCNLFCVLWVHMCINTVFLDDTASLRVIYHPWLLQSFFLHLLAHRSLNLGGTGLIKVSYFKRWALQSLLLCIDVSLHIYYDVLHEEASLMRVLCSAYGYSDMSLGIILLLCSFSRVIVLCFPMGPYLLSGSWTL